MIGVFGSSTENCDIKPESSYLQNNLMSGISYSRMASRSNPKPNAHPILSAAPAKLRSMRNKGLHNIVTKLETIHTP